jgi:manganese oxidase
MSDSTPELPTQAEDTAPPTRRDFLRFSALGLAVPLAGAAVAACGGAAAESAVGGSAAAGAAHADSNHSGGSTAPHPAVPPASGKDWREMDRMHEAGVRAFPAATAGKGNQPMRPRVENGVKVYDLTVRRIQWETEPGKHVEAWAFNDQVPGPQIRVREGDRVRVTLRNELDESTAIHFHGVELPNEVDGVPFLTQPPITPGETYTYEFTVPEGNAGSHMYHSHYNAAQQTMNGMLGAFIVEPRNPRPIEREVDIDYVMILNDGAHGYTINGKGFPATEPITARVGQTVRVRYMNEGMMIHPMHLHGMHMTVIDKDGWPQPAPWRCDTLNVAPGERWDVIVRCDKPGVWAFHCHVLPHAEGPHGMFGMVTALIVEP